MTNHIDDLLEDFEVIETNHLYAHEDDKTKFKHGLYTAMVELVPEKNSNPTEVGSMLFGEKIGYNQALDEVRDNLKHYFGEE